MPPESLRTPTHDRRPLSRPRPALSALAFVAAWALSLGCGGELDTVVALADFVAHQADQVTTRRIAPGSDSERLATHGWRIDSGEKSGSPALTMRRDRARVWFFSADGKTHGVELRGGLARSNRARGRRVLTRLNGDRQDVLVMKPRPAVHRLAFNPESVRQGWNYLQLSMRRLPEGDDDSLVRLRGFRFLTAGDGAESPPPHSRIEIVDGELSMPGGSLLDALFEVPAGARFEGRLRAEAVGERAGPIEVSVLLMSESGIESEVARGALAVGDSAELEAELEPWAGTVVRVRVLVTGSPRASARWSVARVAAPGATRVLPTERLIRPSATPRRALLEPSDVVVILLDAARADAFSPWGGPHPTPALERLAAEGTKFERALAPSSWTGQSVPAMLTGFYPETVGIRHWANGLATDVPTLAELFRDAGYHTALWSQHPIYSRGRTLARGFEQKNYVGHENRERLPELDELFVDGRPSLALVHLLPPHTPYEPPAPFRGRRSGWYTGVPEELPVLEGFPKKKHPEELTADDRKYIRDRYQENVEFADALVGRILERLEGSGRYRDTLIAVISDHGEAFLEHGEYLHNSLLYREFLHVPFVIKWPAALTGFRSVVDETVTMIDLAPTLVSALGLAGADKGFQGADLLGTIFDDAEPLERPIYAITRGDGDPLRGAKRWIRYERDGRAVLWNQLGDRVELYDLESDPGELDDLADERPTQALLLLQELKIQYHFNQALLALGAEDAAELDPELARELKALGYL